MLAPHIHAPSDLVTSHRAVCEGFLAQAEAKTKKAAPYVEQARILLEALHEVRSVELLLKRMKFRDNLITAAGFSDKASSHLSSTELDAAVKEVLGEIAASAGAGFREEIVYRYLLTKGDALGGVMRNLTGAQAGMQLTTELLRALANLSVEPEVQQSRNEKVQGIRWRDRRLLFNRKPAIVGQNVDVILLRGPLNLSDVQLMAQRGRYLACGELKGGIDPAGADEHWKTALAALQRIRATFKGQCPPLFFVGAAIQSAMADEIFMQLDDGRLTYAANLTVPEQLADLVAWLASL